MPCFKIDKPLVVYRLATLYNDGYIGLRKFGKVFPFLRPKTLFQSTISVNNNNSLSVTIHLELCVNHVERVKITHIF